MTELSLTSLWANESSTGSAANALTGIDLRLAQVGLVLGASINGFILVMMLIPFIILHVRVCCGCWMDSRSFKFSLLARISERSDPDLHRSILVRGWTAYTLLILLVSARTASWLSAYNEIDINSQQSCTSASGQLQAQVWPSALAFAFSNFYFIAFALFMAAQYEQPAVTSQEPATKDTVDIIVRKTSMSAARVLFNSPTSPSSYGTLNDSDANPSKSTELVRLEPSKEISRPAINLINVAVLLMIVGVSLWILTVALHDELSQRIDITRALLGSALVLTFIAGILVGICAYDNWNASRLYRRGEQQTINFAVHSVVNVCFLLCCIGTFGRLMAEIYELSSRTDPFAAVCDGSGWEEFFNLILQISTEQANVIVAGALLWCKLVWPERDPTSKEGREADLKRIKRRALAESQVIEYDQRSTSRFRYVINVQNIVVTVFVLIVCTIIISLVLYNIDVVNTLATDPSGSGLWLRVRNVQEWFTAARVTAGWCTFITVITCFYALRIVSHIISGSIFGPAMSSSHIKISWHALTAIAVYVGACVHVASHIVAQQQLQAGLSELDPADSIPFPVIYTSLSSLFSSYAGITGFIMLVSFGGAIVTGWMVTCSCARNRSCLAYSSFYWIHLTFIAVGIAAFCTHGLYRSFGVFPMNSVTLLIAVLVMALLYSISWFIYPPYTVRASLHRFANGRQTNIIRVQFPKPPKWPLDVDSAPGAYATIAMAKEDRSHEHPFTIVSGAASKNIIFHIAQSKNSQWASRLMSSPTCLLRMRGAFNGPISTLLGTDTTSHRHYALLTSAGVGITPIINTLQTWLSRFSVDMASEEEMKDDKGVDPNLISPELRCVRVSCLLSDTEYGQYLIGHSDIDTLGQIYANWLELAEIGHQRRYRLPILQIHICYSIEQYIKEKFEEQIREIHHYFKRKNVNYEADLVPKQSRSFATSINDSPTTPIRSIPSIPSTPSTPSSTTSRDHNKMTQTESSMDRSTNLTHSYQIIPTYRQKNSSIIRNHLLSENDDNVVHLADRFGSVSSLRHFCLTHDSKVQSAPIVTVYCGNAKLNAPVKNWNERTQTLYAVDYAEECF